MARIDPAALCSRLPANVRKFTAAHVLDRSGCIDAFGHGLGGPDKKPVITRRSPRVALPRVDQRRLGAVEMQGGRSPQRPGGPTEHPALSKALIPAIQIAPVRPRATAEGDCMGKRFRSLTGAVSGPHKPIFAIALNPFRPWKQKRRWIFGQARAGQQQEGCKGCFHIWRIPQWA